MTTKQEMSITPATRRQRWMLYILTKNPEVWDEPLTMAEASELIAKAKREQVKETVRKEDSFHRIYKEALEAGKEAGTKCTPVPMIVQQHSNMLDDNSSVEKEWLVPDGACGFAWINIGPGNSSFAKWLIRKGYAGSDSYYGGVCIWIDDYGQSYERKSAHAGAMARVFDSYAKELGIKYAHSRNRLD